MESLLSSTMGNPLGRQLTVLFAPAHIRIDESEGGSEFYWSYKLIERLALDHDVQCIALTIQPHVEHQLPGVRFMSVEPGGRLPTSNLDSLRFHLRCYGLARRVLASGEHVDVIHHMLPFGFRSTFNMLALRRHHADPPMVIGPLQAPLSFGGADEKGVSVRDLSERSSPVASRLHSIPPLSTFITTPALSMLSAQTLRHATARVTTSERAARLYRSYTGLEDFSVISPGVDTDQFTSDSMQSITTRRQQGDGAIRIVAVGYLIRRKAFDVLIEAIAVLVKAGVQVRLCLVGEGPARPELESLVRWLGVESYVTFAGHVAHSSIRDVYRASDIFCSTSRSEGFSTVCLEALACGLPIVATPTGGFREILCHHDVGRLISFGAVDELAQTLAELIMHPQLRTTMGQRAREVAVREYDWRIIAQRYLSIYNTVLQPIKTVNS